MDEDDKNNKDIFIPRNYQVQLMEIALKQNTIIYLPTGSGKTFIAIMVLKQLSSDLNLPYCGGGKISLILVNSVALVDQHSKYVKDHTVFTVGAYTGEMNLDFWTRPEWEAQFNRYQVIIMTTQILVNIINNNFIDLSRVNLIIFDECHRGVDDQPMRQVMKTFQNCEEKPRIIGLTATLLNGNCKLSKVMEKVKALEATYHSQVATVDGLEHVVGFSTNPQEMFKLAMTAITTTEIENAITPLREVIDLLSIVKCDSYTIVNILPHDLKPFENKDIMRNLRNLITDLLIHIEMLGVFGGYKACLAHMIQIERLKSHCQDPKFSIILQFVMTTMDQAKTKLKSLMASWNPADRIHKFSSQKVQRLFEIIKEFKGKSQEELCCLIFVKRRFTAKVLHHILKSLSEVDPDFYHLKTNFVVGNKNNPYNDTRENLFIAKKNREVLDGFGNKEINVLVSSNVLEEGVDIPKCTLVIKFDKAEDYRSYIQSKGRARHKLSLYYTIVEKEESMRFFEKYAEFQRVEQLLNDLLVGKNTERDSPSKSEIEKMYNEDELQPYYVNGPKSARVDMVSAVSLLCRYCSSLARDQYTTYAPEWYIEKERGKIRVIIYLPTVCPIVEPIKGIFMLNKKDAKRAAALEACKQLHKCGELDDNLLPPKKVIKDEDVSFLFEHWPAEKEDRAGIKKKKRLHDKEIPACVKGKFASSTHLYLHVIKLTPAYTRIEDFNQSTIFDMYTTPLTYGLLSPHPLPNLCRFPIFDSNGEITVVIKINVAKVNLSDDELKDLIEFHYLIFNDLLEILKPFLIFDRTGCGTDMLLVVPVQDGTRVHIDFGVVNEHKALKQKQIELTATERINLQVTEESYMHKIVTPWYRPQPTMYIVTQVCMEKTPLSSFPNQDYGSFVSYFDDKHALKILNTKQPLLLVKGLSMRLNTFKPKGREGKKKRDKRYEELEEFLIPELVVKQDFPACLWIQARFLPTILSRLTYLLKLQQLQYQIARDIGASDKYLQNCPALELDMHLLNYVPSHIQFAKPVETSVINNCGDLLPLESPPMLIQQYNKDFASKKLEAEYAWRNIEEPKDIERVIEVTAAEIEYYEMFISSTATKQDRLLKNESPVKTNNYPAITYDLAFEEKPLHILSIKFDNQSPNLCEFYRALTAAEANDIVNLERLETLGDSFLKLIASLYIVFKFPGYNEGKATTLKGKLVSNKNLYYLAVRKNLGGILKNNDLSPNEEWAPPCFCVPSTLKIGISNKDFSVNTLFNCNVSPEEQIRGVLSKRTLSEIKEEECPEDEENTYSSMCHFLQKQYVGDKTLADCVEALLGAFFQRGGVESGINFMQWIGIFPFYENVKQLIESTDIDPILDKNATIHNIDFHIPQWEEFEKRLGYHFQNRAFLLQALTHSSYSPNRVTQSYEKLEFIGDAILDFLITCYIYEYCGRLNPGEVTDLRSALVNNNTFASLVVRCGFHKFMLMINLKLQGHVDKFAEYLAIKNHVIDDEVLILLEEEDLDLAEYVDVPKVLGDLFEALAGAVYLDSGKNLKTVWKVFYKIMWKEFDLFTKNVPKNVIRRLYECHTAYPQFGKTVELENKKTMVALNFMCEGRRKRVHGFGSNKMLAKRAAAKIALRSLKL